MELINIQNVKCSINRVIIRYFGVLYVVLHVNKKQQPNKKYAKSQKKFG